MQTSAHGTQDATKFLTCSADEPLHRQPAYRDRAQLAYRIARATPDGRTQRSLVKKADALTLRMAALMPGLLLGNCIAGAQQLAIEAVAPRTPRRPPMPFYGNRCDVLAMRHEPEFHDQVHAFENMDAPQWVAAGGEYQSAMYTFGMVGRPWARRSSGTRPLAGRGMTIRGSARSGQPPYGIARSGTGHLRSCATHPSPSRFRQEQTLGMLLASMATASL